MFPCFALPALICSQWRISVICCYFRLVFRVTLTARINYDENVLFSTILFRFLADIDQFLVNAMEGVLLFPVSLQHFRERPEFKADREGGAFVAPCRLSEGVHSPGGALSEAGGERVWAILCLLKLAEGVQEPKSRFLREEGTLDCPARPAGPAQTYPARWLLGQGPAGQRTKPDLADDVGNGASVVVVSGGRS